MLGLIVCLIVCPVIASQNECASPSSSVFVYDLNRRFGEIRTLNEALDLISSLSANFKLRRIGTNIGLNFSVILSDLYLSAMLSLFRLNACSQRDLVRLMKAMIAQNNELGLSMTRSLWTSFFAIFYEFPNEMRDGFVFKLLGMMQC